MFLLVLCFIFDYEMIYSKKQADKMNAPFGYKTVSKEFRNKVYFLIENQCQTILT